jgi:8-oxo-dGTP pyrophosphatase MutT (NUDIX family)
MIRAQCIVHRGNKLLMVKHRMAGNEWWCLPGGGVEPGELPVNAALRELEEECCVKGKVLRHTAEGREANGFETTTFLIDIGNQEPRIGDDPEFSGNDQILVELKWLSLDEIPERDRAYLWAAGLLTIPVFVEEVSSWGDDISYPSN